MDIIFLNLNNVIITKFPLKKPKNYRYFNYMKKKKKCKFSKKKKKNQARSPDFGFEMKFSLWVYFFEKHRCSTRNILCSSFRTANTLIMNV